MIIRHINLFKTINKLILNSKNVSIWSPLAEAFNTKPIPQKYSKHHKLGLFNIPALTSHEGFYNLKHDCISRTNDLIQEALSATRQRKIVQIFDDISDCLCQVADLAEFVRLSHPYPEYTTAAQDACGAVSSIVEQLNTNKELYNVLKTAVRSGDVVETVCEDKHVGELFLFDFEQCGIHLSDKERKIVVELNNAILVLGQEFVTGTSTPKTINRTVLPAKVRDIFRQDDENITISGLYSDTANPIAREMAFKIFLYPDAKQETLLNQLLYARDQLAKICGFPTYAHRALRGSTLDTPEIVLDFLQTLNVDLKSKVEADFQCMSAMKRSENNNNDLAAWDVPYYTHMARRDWFRVSAKEYSPYFSIGSCMDGLSILFKSLFGIELVNTPVDPGEIWHPEVYKLSIIHEKEGLLGTIYCDLYERNGKPNQDCHFTIKGGRCVENNDYQLPVVVLMLNLPSPRWSSPSLLTPNMVDNLFHEMGHAMHSMLGRTRYQHVTGTRCSTDFAEVPSILMEYFASDSRVLKRFARHFQTNGTISDEMLDRLIASKHLFTSSETQLQLFYAALDQNYHNAHPLRGTTTQVLAETQEEYYALKYVENTAWQLRFSHLVGYGAKYYSYLVSRAVAYLIWKRYFEKDPFSRENGERYRRECLAFGGGKDPKDLVEEFLGIDVTPRELAGAVMSEIDTHQNRVESVLKQLKIKCS